MNKQLLKSEMVKVGDINETLAMYLNITRETLSHKINGRGCFTQDEIRMIMQRYSLTPKQTVAIFFDSKGE